jgi:hypothetical protein
MIAYMEKNENCKENRFLSMDSLKKNSRFYLVAAFLAAAILALLCVHRQETIFFAVFILFHISDHVLSG